MEPDGDGCGDPSRDSGDIGDRGGGILSDGEAADDGKGEFGGEVKIIFSSKSENSSSEPSMTGSSGSL